MKKQKIINNIYTSIYFVGLLIFAQCSNSDLGYNQMPENYKTDSLLSYKEIFAGLKTTSGSQNGVPYLKVESNDCATIPFCGFLKIISDTMFFSVTEFGKGVPFLLLNARKFSKWSISYFENQIDSVCYLGKTYRETDKDSLMLFWLQPQTRNAPVDASYLKYLMLNSKGVFKYWTFSGGEGDKTIKLDQYPKLVYDGRHWK
jgi:hypothetical protein